MGACINHLQCLLVIHHNILEMSKTIIIKLTSSGSKAGPFDVYDEEGTLLVSGLSRTSLIDGKAIVVDDDVSIITLKSTGDCTSQKSASIGVVYANQLTANNYTKTNTACIWRHLTDISKFNYFYGVTEPYTLEYCFAYSDKDQILQNIRDYTQAYQYFPDGTGVYNYADKIETDDYWFNKAVVYNNQQSSGILNLVAKPKHNLSSYMSYPLFSTDSKTITFTKSDNYYKYNTFWNIVSDNTEPLFSSTCETMSIDKIVNQSNMDYSSRTFKKQPLRARFSKVRHTLDNRNDVHLVSQFIFEDTQISHK